MDRRYRAKVVGCGGLGSAALYWLSKELGPAVLGLEQFRLGHDRGASQDHSRIIRLARHQSKYAALAPTPTTPGTRWRRSRGSSSRPAVSDAAFEKTFHA